MAVAITVPALPESVVDASVAKWHKAVGDAVTSGEVLVELETDKVMLEVPATQDGVITAIIHEQGAVVTSGEKLAEFSAPGEKVQALDAPEASSPTPKPPVDDTQSSSISMLNEQKVASPSARRMMQTHDINPQDIRTSGPKISKADVQAHLHQSSHPATKKNDAPSAAHEGSGLVERVPMSRLRMRIAERLLSAQHEAAMLTTFNEVNMQPIMDLRTRYRDDFHSKHGVKLGFMSFFVKAVTAALKVFPEVNACIDGQDVLYHHYFDIGIAVSSPRGLVVPVLRNCEHSGMAKIESDIGDFANKAREGKLSLEEMTGGTFTITNGGVFGSMLSTPIINPPQSAILGMHNIVKRAVVIDDEIVIRPMMYLALSYDHRLIDGQQSVKFLLNVKEVLEDPSRLTLDV